MADNNNKGAGLSSVAGGAIGAGIGAVGNIIGGLIDQAFAERNARIQRENQEKLMDYQNNLQVEQWNRENAYNDPSAVRARFEKAGIAPQAIFGSGTTAGIAGGLSSAPSGGAQSVSPGNSFGGLGSDMAQGMNAVTTAKRVDAENELVEQQAKKAKWENEVLNPILADLNSALVDEKVADATIKQIDARFRATLNQLEVDSKNASLDSIRENILKTRQEIANLESVKSLTEAQRKAVYKSMEEMDSRIVLNEMKTRLAREEANLANSKAWLTDAQTITEKMRNGDSIPRGLLGAQFIKVMSDIGVNEHQKQHLDRMYELAEESRKNQVRLNTSAEVRKWILGIVNTVLSVYYAGMDSTDSSSYSSSSVDIGGYMLAD